MQAQVKRMPQTVTYGGQTYGPSETPLSVPEELATALRLELVEEATQPSPESPTPTGDAGELAQKLVAQSEKLNSLLSLLAPVAQDGEQPDQVLTRLIAERETAQQEKQAQSSQIASLTADLIQERQTTRLPTDAKERLIAVNKVGPALADDCIAALTAKAE